MRLLTLFNLFFNGQGIVGGAVQCFVQNWCIRRKGPVFVSMFKPLSMGIAATMAVIFLGETLHIGR